MLKILSLAMGIGLGALAFTVQPATAGVQVGISVGDDDGYYSSDCRTVKRWVKRWNPYRHHWNRVKVVKRICY